MAAAEEEARARVENLTNEVDLDTVDTSALVPAVEEMLAAQLELAPDFPSRFAQAYDWVTRIDPHCPLLCPGVEALVERVAPDYLVLEFAEADLSERAPKLRAQLSALQQHPFSMR